MAESKDATQAEGSRDEAFGVAYRLTPMDKLGMWLSRRQIENALGSLRGKRIVDVGSGHEAHFIRSVLDVVEHATVVDISIARDLHAHPRVRAVEGRLPDALEGLEPHSYDFVVSNNVLEHLWNPEEAIEKMRLLLKPGGRCFLNVPSWAGKVVLEAAAFRLGLTVKAEIDDHKAYYDTRELWKLVVRGGFKPSNVRCRAHKLFLNTYAVCTAE